jgi:hypothetical protein
MKVVPATLGLVRRHRFHIDQQQLVVFLLLFLCQCSAFSPASFADFQFAPNGVCLSPRLFVECSSKNKSGRPNNMQYFTMRNVPGEGDCMFLAVALATAASMGLGGNDVLLRAISRETRHVVASVLESGGDHGPTIGASE